MIATYRARIRRGNRLDWLDDRPSDMRAEIPVLITLLPEDGRITAPDRTSSRCVALLSRLASASAELSAIQDPVAWQREQRSERPLPFREA